MPGLLRARVEMVRGSLDRVEAIRDAARGHDACIHNAICWRDEPDERGQGDVRAAANVFCAASEAGVPQLVYTSSTAVHKPYARRMDETMRLAPTDFYGAAKAANEAFLAALSWQNPTRCNVIRPGPVVGGPAVEGARIVTYRTLEEIIEHARTGKDIHVKRGDGRQFIDARDLAQVYRRVLCSNVNRETVLAVASDGVTWEEIASMATRTVGSRSRVIVEDAPGEPFSFDVGKLARDFGFSFEARATIEADIRRLAETITM
jgi:UDP-glucose 4-epimerase